MRRGLLAGLAALGAGIACGAETARPKWGVALEGQPVREEQIAAVTKETTLRPALIVFFQQWPERPEQRDFPRTTLETIVASGAEPVITWEPMFYRAADGAESMISAEAILSGRYDPYLRDYAEAAAAWARPVWIRFAHEMNLSRYHWGTGADQYGPASPEKFRAMWRHVVDVFRQARANNVRWVFCPNCESVPGAGNPQAAPWNTASNYFPGRDYVDAFGMDGYNWGDTQTPAKNGWQSSWRGFDSIFTPLRQELQRLDPTKPVYVFETSSATSGGDKGRWLAEMTTTANAWQLAGVVWFEVRKEIDWRLRAGVDAAALTPLKRGFAESPSGDSPRK